MTTPRTRLPVHPHKGVWLLSLGVLVFSLQDLIIKKVSGSYSLSQVVFIRSVVAMVLLGALVLRDVGLRRLMSSQMKPLLTRAGVMFLSYTAYYMAFPALPLASAVALYFTVPLFVTLLAVLMLGETPHPNLLWAIAIGFAGVLFMLQPGSALFQPAALLSLFSALAYSLAMVKTRQLSDTEPNSVIAFTQNLGFMIGCLLLAIFLHLFPQTDWSHPSMVFLLRPWSDIPWPDVLLIGATGVVASVGIVLLNGAYHIGPANRVGAFEYTGILWAPMWGYLFFQEVPVSQTIWGACAIIAAGLLVLQPQKTLIHEQDRHPH